MCRNIRILFDIDPPATGDEVRAAALQYVRKVSGMARPKGSGQGAFDRAVEEVAGATGRLLKSLARSRDRGKNDL